MPAFREHDRPRPAMGACPGCADVPHCGRRVLLGTDGQPTRCARCAGPVGRIERRGGHDPACQDGAYAAWVREPVKQTPSNPRVRAWAQATGLRREGGA